MEELFQKALEWLSEGQGVALVTVIETKGSTPRHTGAMMLVDEHGRIFQTIGGGAVEHEVTQLAKNIACGKEKATLVNRALGTDLAMCCGGQMSFWIESLANHKQLLVSIQDALKKNLHTVLCTDLKTAEKTLKSDESQSREDDKFYQVIEPPFRMTLFGCGHVGKEIGVLADRCGFQVVACDDNHTGELEESMPWAKKIVASFGWSDVFDGSQPFSELDMVLIVTRDHEKDERLLQEAMGVVDQLGYLGLIGSKGKLGRFQKRLMARGVTTGWEKLHCPIGLNIGAETPIEIAVAVMAELIQVRKQLLSK